MKYKRIGVMCGSSEACAKKFLEMAYHLGEVLGENGHDVVYGGGAKGLMCKVADGALSKGARVDGYIPEFMVAVEWQHNKLTNLHKTIDMSERKEKMMKGSDATIFLPGGSGTMEEFFQWLTAKRLGLYTGPLVIVNFDHYYDPLIELLNNMEKEKFHNPIHRQMWVEVENIENIHTAIENAPTWDKGAIAHASVKKS